MPEQVLPTSASTHRDCGRLNTRVGAVEFLCPSWLLTIETIEDEYQECCMWVLCSHLLLTREPGGLNTRADAVGIFMSLLAPNHREPEGLNARVGAVEFLCPCWRLSIEMLED
ncbi:ly6/PLAUR domain-containing protein 1-like [Platysternon megacephalum]|uniref:Ly6/PLAUR domain-containing protein 1-like n=1 Tax=Platysternon megacephalum TaxID=55544 RepID=A0A4D9DLM5_9SAUR|nr:ly6/PLAUR domain-containing protein 1-like [Platysternon megacephalum]